MWHLVTWIVTFRGRRGTYGTGLALYLATSSVDSAWQAWHLWHLGWLWWRAWVPVDAMDAAAVCVAGVVLGDMDLHFAWQAWHLVTWIVTLRGRRGTYGLRGRRGTW